MKKKFLGIIFIIYSLIIVYTIVFNKLDKLLAPSMQLYIKIAVIPLFIMGIIMLTNITRYKFKYSDLILLLPLIIIILSGNSVLSSTYAKNKSIKKVETIKLKEVEEPVNIDEDYDFSSPYIDIKDEMYSAIANYLFGSPNASSFIGKTVKVRGFILDSVPSLSSDYKSIGKYEISCCAADAEYTGYIIKDDKNRITKDKWYEIEGVFAKGKSSDGYDFIYIKVINVTEISSSSEKLYVYPCYSYDDGACSSLSKYNLQY